MIILFVRAAKGGYNVTYDEGVLFVSSDLDKKGKPKDDNYQGVLDWLAAGNSITVDEPAKVEKEEERDMVIVSAKETKGGYNVTYDKGRFFIPNDVDKKGRPKDKRYQDVLDWLAKGNSIEAEFTNTELLSAAKTAKKFEMKNVCDQKNIESITDFQAAIVDSKGAVSKKTSSFVFEASRHPTNPSFDPEIILLNALALNQSIFYSTKKPTGEKITVALTPEIAKTLSIAIINRNNSNNNLYDAIELAIDAASTVAQVEAITWDTKYLK